MRDLEKEVAEAKKEVEGLERERRTRQNGVKGEMEGLEEAWRTGVGRHIEVMAACEGVRKEILVQRRAGAK